MQLAKKLVIVGSQGLRKQLILYELPTQIPCALQGQTSIASNFITHTALKTMN
jgi:hypothetical protein